MLKPALLYRDELDKLLKLSMFDMPRIKFYYQNSWVFKIEITDDTFSNIQYVSVDEEDTIIGFMNFTVDRDCNYISNISSIKFKPSTDKMFIKDMYIARMQMFDQYGFNKLVYSTVLDENNQSLKVLRKITKDFKGKEVGIHKNHVKLIDGTISDVIYFEILKSNYIKSKLYKGDINVTV